MKAKNQHHQKTIEELKQQNAAAELQSNQKTTASSLGSFSPLISARLLERVKETGQYTRQVHIHHQQEQVKRDPDFNGIQTTRNLLTHENNSTSSSHP